MQTDLMLLASGTEMVLLVFVFVLSIFLGIELISKVPSQLHTPLMSGSNAISGITIVGALLALKSTNNGTIMIVLGVLAVAFAMINVVGGYLVTDRMLGMFQKGSGSYFDQVAAFFKGDGTPDNPQSNQQNAENPVCPHCGKSID